MYKLIAIDVDDTLLNDELEVTPHTRAALKSALEHGVTVTLATGRMFASARQVAEGLQLNVPIITYQGSLVKTLLDGKVLYERTVPSDAAAELNQYCLDNGLHLQLYVDDKLYVREDNDKVRDYARNSKIPFIVAPDFDSLLSQPLLKMLIIDEPERLDALIPELQPLIGDRVHMTKSKAHYLEFMHKEGTKGHALRFIAEHIGCTMEETIAMGDGWNDREMLMAAGLGVAMGNAQAPLKEIADYITLSNNEDGVAHVVEKFILTEQTVQ
ncbi:Cof-type HAD-IIB family hydrolase [Paenibacillus pasadenensis]|uniref:Cof-type HAD-IIB family hydrolase n=1 Tax=Paenibacillus pasadenensis TaxID=217090 RepID=UPI00203A5B52|nr:Cof-type HAD-IIB family hydrolase [Paenibacillus pasadenensis]MCM3749850.1 Cof-type HAD-IIB family hydrolase [Paenibacillus pasadenensis]